MMEICFNNREADVGTFIRRQLSGLDAVKLVEALQSVLVTAKAPTPAEVLISYMDEMYSRFLKRQEKCEPRPPKTGVRESAAIILGEFVEPDLSRQYMTRFLQVPHYSGWPPWVGLLNIHSSLGGVNYIDDGWESFEYVTKLFQSLDFSRIDASGRFYYAEAMRDDIAGRVTPGQHFEFAMETARVAEIIAMCLTFAKEFCGRDSPNDLAFAFRWRDLRGRRLSSWASPRRNFYSRGTADQDEIVTSTTMPVATVPDAIGLHVETVVKPLFRLFGGWEFDSSVIQDIVVERLRGRL